MPPRSYVARFGLGIALAAIPVTAFAHTGHGIAQGFSSGFVHPLQGLDHLIAMVAVGMIAARMGGRSLWALPAAFLSMLALGGFRHARQSLAICRDKHCSFPRSLWTCTSLRLEGSSYCGRRGCWPVCNIPRLCAWNRDSCRLPVGRLRVWVHAGRRASDRRWNRLRAARSIAPKSLI
jgi:hypothetical protein